MQQILQESLFLKGGSSAKANKLSHYSAFRYSALVTKGGCYGHQWNVSLVVKEN